MLGNQPLLCRLELLALHTQPVDLNGEFVALLLRVDQLSTANKEYGVGVVTSIAGNKECNTSVMRALSFAVCCGR